MKITMNLLANKDLLEEKKRRSLEYEYVKIKTNEINKYIEKGWILDKKYKQSARMRRNISLSVDEKFKNEVWILFYKLGFLFLNGSQSFKLFIDEINLIHEADIFAADDEAILIFECRAASKLEKKVDFQKDIELLNEKKRLLTVSARKLFPNRKLKVKLIFATKNYVISQQNKDLLQKYDIAYFDDDSIKYYNELFGHIGLAARYQLLGNLFAGRKIPELNNIVPAIEGEMGKHTYYSFSIEPKKLLKLGFVLHHNNANKDEMPAYQRIIKKERLKSVRAFIDNGGFFPNSIIISIESKNKLQFDRAGLQDVNSISKIGLLHLPQVYKSVYIIDGQHRLYGYSDSEWSMKNTIPVVAFVNLSKNEQIQLFMDINENQKAVPKNLRTTLESNLLWNAEDYNDRRKALGSHIAQKLAEDRRSPLCGRVITGENKSSSFCAITLDIIVKALKQCNFYNVYKKQDIIKDGTFDKGNIDTTAQTLYPFILQMLDYMETYLKRDWDFETSNNNNIVANTFVYGYIRVFSDIVDYLISKNRIFPKQQKVEDIVEECKPFLDVIIDYIRDLSADNRISFRKQYGRVGDVRFLMCMRLAIHNRFEDFNPEGLEKFWQDNSMKYNEEAFKIIRDIELYIKKNVFSRLQDKFGANWFRLGCPKNVYDNAQKLASDKNYEKTDNSVDEIAEDQLHLIDYRDIILYSSNWSELFEQKFADPNIKGDKKKRTEWMQKLNSIRNQNFHTYSITSEEFELLNVIKSWLIN